MEAYVICNGELYHHGIKGQKWGVRRFQNEDGSLTAVGKKRYDDSPGDKSTKPTKQKSKHRTRLEERYMSEGMTAEEAAKKANDRIRTEKVLSGIAGVTVAAAGAYLVTKYVKERTDQVIKSGDTMQRIQSEKKWFGSKDRNLHDAFYVTNDPEDNQNFEDVLGNQRKRQSRGLFTEGKAYKLGIKATGDIKIASQKKARDVLEDLLLRDPEFRNNVYESYYETNLHNGNRIPKRYMERIRAGKRVPGFVTRQIYDNFNSNLLGKPNDSSVAKSRDIFYGSLKRLGYGGIQDMNDLKWSRLRAKNPLIIFDKSKVVVETVENITDKMSYANESAAYKRLGRLRGQQAAAKALPALSGVSVSTASAYYLGGLRKSKVIEQYRKEHPNTKLTDRQIAAMYSKSSK